MIFTVSSWQKLKMVRTGTMPRTIRLRSYSSISSLIKSATKPDLYSVCVIDSNGKLSSYCKPISYLLKMASMNARDLINISLTPTESVAATRNLRTPAAILPRKNQIIVSFGNIRAVISTKSGILFDAHKPSVQMLAEDIADTFFIRSFELNQMQVHNKKNDTEGEFAFEIIFLEEILREVCDTYKRRLHIYEPIVDTIVKMVSNEMFTASGIHRLVPIKDSLQQFELNVMSALECLTDLLSDDDDMLGLLLTEKMIAEQAGEDVTPTKHETVEILLEEYARQLSNILLEIKYLLKKVQSKQEMISISLDAYRNRMIHMNVYLSIAGISLGGGTAVAGFYGMNVPNGLEQSTTAFQSITSATALGGIILGIGCVYYISGGASRKRTIRRVHEIEIIDGALSKMNALDYAMKCLVEKDKPMTKDDFRKRMNECKQYESIKDDEVDLLFNSLDGTQDGFLYRDDFSSLADIGRRVRREDKEETKDIL